MWDTIIGGSLLGLSIASLIAVPVCIKIKEIKERRAK